MTYHYECLGFSGDVSEFERTLAEQILPRTEVLSRSNGLDLRTWQDPSGAQILVAARNRDVECIMMGFVAQAEFNFLVEDAYGSTCPWCQVTWVEHENLDFDALVIELNGPRAVSGSGTRLDVRLAAFAETVKSWPSEDAYEADPNAGKIDDEWRLATRSLFAHSVVQVFDGQPTTSHYEMTGVVRRAEKRRNTLTGQDFVHGVLSTNEIDVEFVASNTTELPAPGHVIQGVFWFSGLT